jgi:hypothetical protein
LVSDGAGEPLAALVRDLQFGMHRPEAAVLLCIDQLEELFTLSAWEEAGRFIGTVRAAAEARGSPILIAATLRSDFLGAVQSQAASREASFAQLLVNPMAIGRIGQIIEGPAAVASLELEPGLVPAMLRDTETESALPLLAFTLRELWEHRRGDRLTIDVYRDQLGGLSGSVAKAAEGVLGGAGAMSSLQEGLLRQAFLSLVRVNEEGRFTRCPANWADLPEPVHPLLERFVQARLLISRQDGDARTLEVAHEALLRAWGRLATWLDQDRAFLLWRKRLDQALEFWTEGAKGRERLLPRPLLRESEAQLKEHGDSLSKDERALIGASIAADRRARRVRAAIAGAGALVALIVAAGFAERQAVLANHQLHTYLAQAITLRGTLEPERRFRSLDLLAKAAKLRWTTLGVGNELRDEAVAAMALVELRDPRVWNGYPLGSRGIGFNSNLERYARGDAQGNISIRRIVDDKELMHEPGFGSDPRVLRFSPDDRYLAAKYDGDQLKDQLYVWDLSRPGVDAKYLGKTCGSAFDFDANSQVLAVGRCDGSGSIDIFDLASASSMPTKRLKQALACW